MGYSVTKWETEELVDINWQAIVGNWHAGVALDLHTISSTLVGYSEAGNKIFDTVRPPIAELLNQLKYKNNQGAAQGIIKAAAVFVQPYRAKFDILIPAPPSTPRALQPVYVLADGIGAVVHIPVIKCIETTRPTTQLKNEHDPAKRKQLVAGLYDVDPQFTAGKNILLFDDVFRSGTTLNEITKVLIEKGKAVSVRVLTITKTRSKQ